MMYSHVNLYTLKLVYDCHFIEQLSHFLFFTLLSLKLSHAFNLKIFVCIVLPQMYCGIGIILVYIER